MASIICEKEELKKFKAGHDHKSTLEVCRYFSLKFLNELSQKEMTAIKVGGVIENMDIMAAMLKGRVLLDE